MILLNGRNGRSFMMKNNSEKITLPPYVVSRLVMLIFESVGCAQADPGNLRVKSLERLEAKSYRA